MDSESIIKNLKMRNMVCQSTITKIFDLLYYWNINLLKKVKQLGDYLIVVVSSDEFNLKEKNKICYFNYEHRKNLVEAIRYVDLVIPETNWEQKNQM